MVSNQESMSGMTRIIPVLILIGGFCLLAAGCGDGRLKTRGQVIKDGKPLIPKGKNESVRVTFVPINEDKSPPKDYYHAIYNREDGTFWSAGKDKLGMPPGKYRVAVSFTINKEEQLDSRFDEEHSTYEFVIDANTKDLVINLDSPPG